MNTKIIKGLALAFSLGIAPGAVFAQTATEGEMKKPQLEGEAATQGQAGGKAGADATMKPDAGAAAQGEAGTATEGEAGTTAETPRPEGQSDTTAQGEMKPADGQSGATAKTPQDKPDTTAEGEMKPADGQSGATAEGEAKTDGGTTAESETKPPEGQAGATAEGEARTEGGATAEGEAGVSGETTAAVDVTVEQKTQIREVVREVEVEPIDVDFDVSVGVAVPQTIELRPLPPRIVEIVPEYEGYLFFVLADGRIVIVDPDSHEVVVIIA